MLKSKHYILGFFLILGTIAFLHGCAGGGEGEVKSAVSKNKKQGGSKDSAPQQQQQQVDSDVAPTNRTITYSTSHNELTSHVLAKGEAKDLVSELRSKTKNADYKDALKLRGLVTAETLAGLPFDDVLKAAKRMIAIQMKHQVDSQVEDQTKLQLAIASLHSKRFNMTQFMLAELSDSKNPDIRAAVLNLDGLLAFYEERYPEAAALWNQAMRVKPGYRPAKLNLGFLALKYGDFRTAKQQLRDLQNDWFALYGMAVAERGLGNRAGAQAFCNRVLSQKPEYKPALLTCALNKYQNGGDFAEGKEMLDRVFKSSFGPKSIDEIGYRVLSNLKKDQAKTSVADKGGAKAKKVKAQKK